MTDSNNDPRLDDPNRANDPDPLDDPDRPDDQDRPDTGQAAAAAVVEDSDDPRMADDGSELDLEVEPAPLMPSAPLGLVGLHDLATHLTAAGFVMVSVPDLKICAQRLQSAVRTWAEAAGEHDLMPVLMLNTPQVAGLIPRIQRHVALTVLGTTDAPVAEAEGYRGYQLPGTVRDIVKNAGIDGYEHVPDHLELNTDGRLLDLQRGWDDWEPESDDAHAPVSQDVADPETPADLGDAVFGVKR